ncbi:AAA family ATPase (plasmid) [Bernardetia sp. Wsw4-3y2]|uniref:AAA family ATPase n=1 Tax=Bernardetia sp. Wsw4-3y2 TaxID=3127471 RepID=UPI0030D2CC54
MQFEFKNLGTIKEAQLEMGNLTVICGKNNTGKTYLTYGIWGILDIEIIGKTNIELFSTRQLEDIDNYIDKAKIEEDESYFYLKIDEEHWSKAEQIINSFNKHSISSVFASNGKGFHNLKLHRVIERNRNFSIFSLDIVLTKDFSLEVKISKRESSLKELLTIDNVKQHHAFSIFILLIFIQSYRNNIFLLPAQRDSIELFYKELDKNRSHLLEKLRTTRDLSLLDKESSRFPQPIEKLIDFARDLTRQVIKTESFLAKEYPELLKEVENLLGVTYEVSGDEVLIKDNYSTQKIPAYMASTSVRSLMHLHFWLKHKVQKGDLLMIDEPELNLHPENQIKMARLFAKLVNAGIKVWITTHSDYIIKELNNCLMFSQEIENKKELLEELGYKENEILKRDDIRAYIARYDEKLEGCTVDKVEFDEYGMVMTTFDEQARNINTVAHRLADEIDEENLKQTTTKNN